MPDLCAMVNFWSPTTYEKKHRPTWAMDMGTGYHLRRSFMSIVFILRWSSNQVCVAAKKSYYEEKTQLYNSLHSAHVSFCCFFGRLSIVLVEIPRKKVFWVRVWQRNYWYYNFLRQNQIQKLEITDPCTQITYLTLHR